MFETVGVESSTPGIFHNLNVPRDLDRQFQPEMVDHSGQSLRIQLATVLGWNGQPFKAGIANQIFNWVYLYLSCWMGGWWYGSDHNDLSLCMESFQG